MVCGAWARLRRASSGGPRWSGWSSGPRSVGCTSSRVCRSARSSGGRGCIATRSGGRSAAASRRSIGGRRRGRSSIRSRTRSTGCCATDPKLPGVRVRELLEPLGCTAGKTVVDDYLREVRPLFAPRAEDVSADGLSAGRDLPVRRLAAARGGAGRARPDAPRLGRGRVPGLLARRRRRAGVLDARPRICWPGSPAAWSAWAALPQTLVWDRQAGIHGHGGRPIEAFAAFCGQLRVDWRFCEPADPQAKGAVERLQGYAETNFEPGRALRQRARLPGPARRLVRARSTRARTRRCGPGRSIASPRSWRSWRRCPSAMPDTRAALGDAGPAGPVSARRHQRLLARPGAGRPARRGQRRPARRSRRSRWTPASWPAGTRGSSRGTGRSPRSSTPAR